MFPNEAMEFDDPYLSAAAARALARWMRGESSWLSFLRDSGLCDWANLRQLKRGCRR